MVDFVSLQVINYIDGLRALVIAHINKGNAHTRMERRMKQKERDLPSWKKRTKTGNTAKSAKLRSYSCNLTENDRWWECGKKDASKDCLTFSGSGNRCKYLKTS